MAYIIHWGFFVADDDMDPVAAARLADEARTNPQYLVYGLHQVESGRRFVVDLLTDEVSELETDE